VNAGCVERLGVGSRLEYAEVTSDTLKRRVLAMLSDGEVQKHMTKIQELIQRAPGNIGAAEMIVDYVQINILNQLNER
jgi:UDP:flavonoid glycosyltransferase YjiC (YdhE family)